MFLLRRGTGLSGFIPQIKILHMKNGKAFLILIHLIFLEGGWFFFPASAGPARPGMLKVIQKDGSEINVRVYGDEFRNRITTEDGYLLTDAGDGNWYFAEEGADGKLISTGIKAKPVNSLSSAERGRIRKSLNLYPAVGRQAAIRRLSSSVTTSQESGTGVISAPPLAAGTTWKAEGKKKILVLLAEFRDVPFSSGTKSAFESLLNSGNYSVNGATGSAKQYFYDNSAGKFDPEFVVAGPYRLSKDRASYRDDAAAMVTEVAGLADSDINYSEYSESGTIRDIFVYYSGGSKSDAVPDAIWPHRSQLASDIVLDGASLKGYACSSELEVNSAGSSSTFATIGSFCHEFGHTIGWPDLYDNNSGNGNAEGPRFFSLMDIGCYNNDGKTPPALGILERWMAGWAEPEILETRGAVTLSPVAENHGYLIRTRNGNEYFLLECRGTDKTVWDRKDYLDYYSAGKAWGLLVGHVDISNTAGWKGYAPNDIPGKEGYVLLYSDPSREKDMEPAYFPTHCFFPGGKSVTAIPSSSATGFVSRDGQKTALEITDIKPDESTGTVTLTLEEPGAEISDLKIGAYEHDAIVSWKDDLSTSWTVTWKPKGGTGDAGSQTVSECAIHIPALEADREYELDISGDRSGSPRTASLKTAAKAGGLPRIILSEDTPKSGEKVLLEVVGCEDFIDIQWNVDGAKTDGHTTLAKGEHYIQAAITCGNGSRKYFARYVNIIL